jgi:hypothetical protein
MHHIRHPLRLKFDASAASASLTVLSLYSGAINIAGTDVKPEKSTSSAPEGLLLNLHHILHVSAYYWQVCYRNCVARPMIAGAVAVMVLLQVGAVLCFRETPFFSKNRLLSLVNAPALSFGTVP